MAIRCAHRIWLRDFLAYSARNRSSCLTPMIPEAPIAFEPGEGRLSYIAWHQFLLGQHRLSEAIKVDRRGGRCVFDASALIYAKALSERSLRYTIGGVCLWNCLRVAGASFRNT